MVGLTKDVLRFLKALIVLDGLLLLKCYDYSFPVTNQSW